VAVERGWAMVMVGMVTNMKIGTSGPLTSENLGGGRGILYCSKHVKNSLLPIEK
jgi:hypothetical protein